MALMAAAPSFQLTGRPLTLARSVWLALVLLTLTQYVAAIVVRYEALREPCLAPEDVCHAEPRRPTPADAAEMAAYGLPLPHYAALELAKWLFFSSLWFAVGGLIFARRSDEVVALLASFFLMTFPSQWDRLNLALINAFPITALPVQGLQRLAQLSMLLFVALFPNGRFVPRWTQWLALLWILTTFAPSSLFSGQPWQADFDSLLLTLNLVGLAGMVAGQVIRYRRYSNALERQRIKWVVFGLCLSMLFIVAMVSLSLSGLSIGPTEGPWPGVVAELVYQVTVAPIPASIGLAILRAHLFDIDIIIRRTLVYTVLTAVLALTYLGSVVMLQGIFSAVTGESRNELVTVLSTLALAALFVPLRGRVQRVIDRRFYRRKYDAARTLAGFGAQVRDVVELEQLQGQLVGVVNETMQPASVSLWVQKSGRP